MDCGMTVDEAIAYELRHRFVQKVKKVVAEVTQPVYLDDNLYYLDELLCKVAGQSPFKEM